MPYQCEGCHGIVLTDSKPGKCGACRKRRWVEISVERAQYLLHRNMLGLYFGGGGPTYLSHVRFQGFGTGFISEGPVEAHNVEFVDTDRAGRFTSKRPQLKARGIKHDPRPPEENEDS